MAEERCDDLDVPVTSLGKACEKCGKSYKGWGDTCSTCRSAGHRRSSLAQVCSQCGEYFSGFGDSCGECRGGADVYLYVYDLWEAPNDLQYAVFQHGLYHGAVEVHGKEWQFGGGGGLDYRLELGTDPGFMPNPKRLHQGFTKLTAQQVDDLIDELSPAWQDDTYDLLRRNCVHFAEAFLDRLGVQPPPKWVNRAAREAPKDVLGFVARTGISSGAGFALTRGAVAGVGAVGFGAVAGPVSIPALAGEMLGGRLGGHIGEAVGGDEGQEAGRLAGSILGSVSTGAGVGAVLFGPVGAGIGAGVGALSFATGRIVDAAISNLTKPADVLSELGAKVND